MSSRGAVPTLRTPAAPRAHARRLRVVTLTVERRLRCPWCLWEASAAGADVEMRLRVMQQAHLEIYHPDGRPS